MNCYFKGVGGIWDGKCTCLTISDCPTNCKFRKTKKEFEAARMATEIRLTDKQLEPREHVDENGVRRFGALSRFDV